MTGRQDDRSKTGSTGVTTSDLNDKLLAVDDGNGDDDDGDDGDDDGLFSHTTAQEFKNNNDKLQRTARKDAQITQQQAHMQQHPPAGARCPPDGWALIPCPYPGRAHPGHSRPSQR